MTNLRTILPASLSLLSIAAGASGCGAVDPGQSGPDDDVVQASSIPGNGPTGGKRAALDLDGTPDLMVRADMLGKQWLVRDEEFDAEACSVEEAGVQPGYHRVIRFTVGVANIGDADLFIGDPNDHFTPWGDAFGESDGVFEYATCHQHFHFRHYVNYELIAPDGQKWRAAKRGFCMLDTDPNPAWLGQQPKNKAFDNCGEPGVPGFQGISAGWTDTYRFDLGGQYFVIDGADGQPVVPPGKYRLRITANPAFLPAPGEPCPVLDPRGFCHTLRESNYENNSAEFELDIPAHPGRKGYGPAANG